MVATRADLAGTLSAAELTRRTAAVRALPYVTVVAGVVLGFLAIDQEAAKVAVSRADPDLVRLLRAMTLIKALLVVGAASGLTWRLVAPITGGRLTAYLAATAAMSVGLGPIWQMTHVLLGAMLLHSGLLLLIVMLWRDPAVAELLARRIYRS